MEHSSLGPSQWDRWVRCPGSVVAVKGILDMAEYEASEGTVFHHLVATCLEHGLDPFDWASPENGADSDGRWIPFDREMAESAVDGMEMVRRWMDDPEWTVLIEKRVDISRWAGEGQFGTADVIAWSVSERRVIIFDWKYGKGVPVYPQSSYQLRAYALGSWYTYVLDEIMKVEAPTTVTQYDEFRFDLVIEQPRISTAGGTHTTTLANLMAFGAKVRAARAEAQAGLEDTTKAVYRPGPEQCMYCLAQTKCSAFAEWNLRSIGLEFDDLDNLNPQALLPKEVTPERRSAILLMQANIGKWLQNLHASAYHDAMAGRSVPYMKLVKGRRPARKWKPDFVEYDIVEPHVEARGIDPWETPKLKSPAVVEKEMGRAAFAETMVEMVDHGESKLILVPEEHGGTPVGSIVEEFDIL